MRLNGWQRIGIVASALWALTSPLWGIRLGMEEADYAKVALSDCLAEHGNSDACWQTFHKDLATGFYIHWVFVGLAAFVPIILGWVGAYITVKIVRWVRRGFIA